MSKLPVGSASFTSLTVVTVFACALFAQTAEKKTPAVAKQEAVTRSATTEQNRSAVPGGQGEKNAQPDSKEKAKLDGSAPKAPKGAGGLNSPW